MLISHSRYEATDYFIGFLWRGTAIIGVDVAPWAWGIVAGRLWAGWYWEE